MSVQNFYRVAATLPLALPLISAAIILGLIPVAHGGEIEATPVIGVGVYLWLSLLVAGLPYVTFIAATLLALRNRSEPAYRKASFLAPPLFGLLLAACWVGFGAFARPLTTADALRIGFFFLGHAIVVGYLYVGLTLATLRVFKRAGWVAAS